MTLKDNNEDNDNVDDLKETKTKTAAKFHVHSSKKGNKNRTKIRMKEKAIELWY